MKPTFTLTPRTIRLLLLCLSTTLVAACGGEERAADGKTTIRISHFWGDPDVKQVWEEAIAEFERSHPTIDVVQQVMPFNTHVESVMTSAAAGSDVGDLILLEDWFAQGVLKRNFLVDLAPMINRDLKPDEFFPMSLDNFHDGQAIRAFPVALGSYPLFYNKDLFDKAGVRYPDSTWTYDTLVAAATKLTKDDDGDGRPDQWGFLLDNSGGFDGVIYSLGGAVLTDDLQRSAFNQPRTLAALHYWVDLVQKHKVAPLPSSLRGGTSSGGSTRPFETGRYAMAMLHPSLATYRSVPFKWDIALPPSGPAGRKCLRFANAFGIPQSSKNVDAAWTFLRWIVQEMPSKYADRMFFGLVPNSRRLALSKDYLDGQPKVDRQVLIDMVSRYGFSYWRSKWAQFRDEGFLPELDAMTAGEKSVEEAAAAADQKINAVLSEPE